MSDRHSSPSRNEPEDNMSEADPSSYEDSTSSNSEEATAGKEKGDTCIKRVVKCIKPIDISSSDSNPSTASTCSAAVLPDINKELQDSQRSANSQSAFGKSISTCGPAVLPGIREALQEPQRSTNSPSATSKTTPSTCSTAVSNETSKVMPGSQRSTNSPFSPKKSPASPKRLRSERHFAVFREIRRISKERMRAKQMLRNLKNFLINYPLASLMAAQTLKSASSTSGLQFPGLSCLKHVKSISSSDCTSACVVKETEDALKAKAANQFVADRVNNVTEVLDEIETLENFIAQRKFFDTDTPGTSSRFPTHDGESIMRRHAAKVLDCLKNLRNLAEGLRSWCLSERATVEELKYYMNLLNATSFSSPDSVVIRQLLGSWERNSGSVNQLGDAHCLMQVETRLQQLRQSLIAESHVMHYKYWSDKSREK